MLIEMQGITELMAIYRNANDRGRHKNWFLSKSLQTKKIILIDNEVKKKVSILGNGMIKVNITLLNNI